MALSYFFAYLFTLENKYYFIHAGAVEIKGNPILFIANSFGGKSTLTDYFIKKNHTMISDDKVATFIKEELIYAVPSYPYHRPYRKVEDLGIFIENFSKENKPISKIYNLIKSDEKEEIFINEIHFPTSESNRPADALTCTRMNRAGFPSSARMHQSPSTCSSISASMD